MTSRLYVPIDIGLIIAEKNNDIKFSNQEMTKYKFNALLWCTPTLIIADLDL